MSVTVVYTWSDDGWWVAEIAEVPGAIAQGKTREEARDSVIEALQELHEARRNLALNSSANQENVETVRLAG